ncbi:MAG: tRNA (N6-threonylcarbamoyladenosine(37)-N6)-methyltransferase TrmO [Gammaproteobacteria bacterium]|nr:tRNA (N6-threonylcarbamoyladenosine(37)-N6)-methyltransferase TrmO [Gammaproteobacteria bacterium]
MGAQILIEPVALVRSPFHEKFAVPRQSGLAPSARGEVVLLPPFDDPATLDGLDGFSHVWLTFQFDRCAGQGWRPRVRPPRLGGNREVGVWASRSPFRPNGLGLSAVRLLEVVRAPEAKLRVAGLDLLDATPVFDIKPYLPYADAIADASGGYAPTPPEAVLDVRFTPTAQAALAAADDGTALRALIVDVLTLDPRPAYRPDVEPDRVYGALLAGHDVRWRVDGRGAEVLDVVAVAALR